jgi:cobalt/nickel transport system permease protein
MRDRVYLVLYLVAVVAVTTVHQIVVLAAALGATLLLSGRSWWRLGKRAFLTIVVFNTLVTAGYAALSLLEGTFSPHYVVLLNLRVFLLTFLTFLAVQRIDAFRALSSAPTLSYLLVLIYSQVLTFQRIFLDFRLALRSRTLGRVPRREGYRHAAVLTGFLLGKSIGSATEVAQAMKSRGYFDD